MRRKWMKQISSAVLSAALILGQCFSYGGSLLSWMPDVLETRAEEATEETSDYSYEIIEMNSDENGSAIVSDEGASVLKFGSEMVTGEAAAVQGVSITNPFVEKYELVETMTEALENSGKTFNGLTSYTSLEYPYILERSYIFDRFMKSKSGIYVYAPAGTFNTHAFVNKEVAIEAYNQALANMQAATAEAIEMLELADSVTDGSIYFRNDNVRTIAEAIRDGAVTEEMVAYTEYGYDDGSESPGNPADIEGEFSYPLPEWREGVTISTWVKVAEDAEWSSPIFSFVHLLDGLVLRTDGTFMFLAGSTNDPNNKNLCNAYVAKFSGNTPFAEKGKWVYVTLSVKNDEVHVYYNGVEAEQTLNTITTAGKTGSKNLNGGFGIKAWGTEEERLELLLKSGRYPQILQNYAKEDTDYSDVTKYSYNEDVLMMEFLTDWNTLLYVGGYNGYALYNIKTIANGKYLGDSDTPIHWAACDGYCNNMMVGRMNFIGTPVTTTGDALTLYETALVEGKDFELEEEPAIPIPSYMVTSGTELINTAETLHAEKKTDKFSYKVTELKYDEDTDTTYLTMDITNITETEQPGHKIGIQLQDALGEAITYTGGIWLISTLETLLLEFGNTDAGETVTVQYPISGIKEASYAYDYSITKEIRKRGTGVEKTYAQLVKEEDTKVLEFGDIATGAAVKGLEITNPFAGKYKLAETMTEALANSGKTFNGLVSDVSYDYPYIHQKGYLFTKFFYNSRKARISTFHKGHAFVNKEAAIEDYNQALANMQAATAEAIEMVELADAVTDGSVYFATDNLRTIVEAIRDGAVTEEMVVYTDKGYHNGGESPGNPADVEGEFSYPLPEWRQGITVSGWVKVAEDAVWSSPIFSFVNGCDGLVLRTDGTFMFVGDRGLLSEYTLRNSYVAKFTGNTPFDKKGEWVYVTLSVKNDEVHVYYNGVEAEQIVSSATSVSSSRCGNLNGGFGIKAWGTDEERLELLLEKEKYPQLLKNYEKEDTDYSDVTKYYYKETVLMMEHLTDEETQLYVGGDDGTALYNSKTPLYDNDYKYVASGTPYTSEMDSDYWIHWAECNEYASGLKIGAMSFKEYPVVTSSEAVSLYEAAVQSDRSFNQMQEEPEPETSEEPEASAAPKESAVPAPKRSEVPAESAAPSAEPTPSPKASTVPSKEPTPSPKASTAPSEVPTPTPILKASTAPGKEPTPSPKASTAPSEEPTPSPKASTAPSKEPTPNPKTSTAPSKEPTPTPVVSMKPSEAPQISLTPAASIVPTKETTTEKIENEDGSITDKVTEKEVLEDGTVSEKIVETTTNENGEVTEKIEETIMNPDGSTTTSSQETITKPDGGVEKEEQTTTQDKDGLLVSILKKLIQMAKDIYESLTTTEKEQADGSVIMKEIEEISRIDEDGNVVKEKTVRDEKKDAEGKSVEKYEYDAEVLPEDVEWKTNVVEQLEEQDKKAIEEKGAKDYVTYDITPESQGNKVEVENGNVKVGIHCGDKWNGKNVKVFDFEKNRWLDAHVEGKYVYFYAEHFSKYAIAEVNDVKKGDVDRNGSVELADAQKALKAALKIESLEGDALLAADVDENGTVELADAQQILKYALKIIMEFQS